MLDRSAAHRLATQVGDQKAAGRRDDLVGLDGDARAGIEARIRAAVELGEVGADAAPGVRVRRIDPPDLNRIGYRSPTR
jgi:hypothetical protein